MTRANDFKDRYKDRQNATKQGITPQQATKRLIGAASTVAMQQKQLRVNCDDMTTNTKNDTVEMLEADGFIVTTEKDPKKEKRVWFVLDWSDPSPDELVDA